MFAIRCVPPEILGHLNLHQIKFYNLFLKAGFFVWDPTLLKLFQESETALLSSDREVKYMCKSKLAKTSVKLPYKIFLQFSF